MNAALAALKEIATRADETLEDSKSSGRSTLRAISNKVRSVFADAQSTCRHPSYTQDSVTGECKCDECDKLLIDSIGRVLE